MPTEIKKIRNAVVAQVKQTDAVIASNEAIADIISGLDNTLSEVQGTLTSGFSMLGSGLQELCFLADEGFREISYKLDLQNETLEAIKEILERPLDTQAKELRKRGEYAYPNNWIDEAENDLLESEKKNYQDFIALHILGNIYCHHKKNNQKALEYFQKAAKYAAPQSKNDACKALVCAAKVYKELGKPEDAYKSTGLAIGLLPEDTHNLYNHAAYAAITRHTDESIDCLKKAEILNKDSACLIAADSDERFSNVKQEKEVLKKKLRDEQRQVVEQLRERLTALRKDFDYARDVAEEVGITDFSQYTKDLDTLSNGMEEIDKLHSNNAYLDLLKAESTAHNYYKKGIDDFNRNVEGWMKAKKASINKLEDKVESTDHDMSLFPAGITLILVYFFLAGSKYSDPKYPFISALAMIIMAPLLFLGHLIGVNDKTFAGGPLAFWGGWISPIIVQILVTKMIKTIKLNAIRSELEKENNTIARLSNLKKVDS